MPGFDRYIPVDFLYGCRKRLETDVYQAALSSVEVHNDEHQGSQNGRERTHPPSADRAVQSGVVRRNCHEQRLYTRHTRMFRRDARLARPTPTAALRLFAIGPAMPRRRALLSDRTDAPRLPSQSKRTCLLAVVDSTLLQAHLCRVATRPFRWKAASSSDRATATRR
jgi:hypothetical protein